MVDVGAKGEEALKGVGDVGFDLLRRHAVVESGHHHDRHIDLGKQIHRHLNDVHRADERNHQAKHDDEKGISEEQTSALVRSSIARARPSCRSCRLFR